jgi:hypothetical protein
MNLVTRSVQRTFDIVGRRVSRVAALIIGFVLTVAGLAMTATIVMLPVGIVTLLLGVLIFVGGLYAPAQ